MPGGIATRVGALELRRWIDDQVNTVDLEEPLLRWEEPTVKFVIPVEKPDISTVVERLQDLERLIKFAVLMCVLDRDQLDRAGTLEGVFLYDSQLTLEVVDLGLSSIRSSIKIE